MGAPHLRHPPQQPVRELLLEQLLLQQLFLIRILGGVKLAG